MLSSDVECSMPAMDQTEDHWIKVQGYDEEYSLDFESESKDDFDDAEDGSELDDAPLEKSDSDSGSETE
jgi:hypothetical protein